MVPYCTWYGADVCFIGQHCCNRTPTIEAGLRNLKWSNMCPIMFLQPISDPYTACDRIGQTENNVSLVNDHHSAGNGERQ